jgi:hypothetical protein
MNLYHSNERLHLDKCTTSKTYIQYAKKSWDRNHTRILFLHSIWDEISSKLRALVESPVRYEKNGFKLVRYSLSKVYLKSNIQNYKSSYYCDRVDRRWRIIRAGSRINLSGSDIMNPWDDVCNMIHEGFTTSCNRIRYQNGLIREHEFVPTRLKAFRYLLYYL